MRVKLRGRGVIKSLYGLTTNGGIPQRRLEPRYVVAAIQEFCVFNRFILRWKKEMIQELVSGMTSE